MRALGICMLALCLLAGCGDDADTVSQDGPRTGPVMVHAVNHPLAAMATRIGGDDVVVTFPVPRGSDPAFWRPTEAQIAAYQDAELILINGADYAKWVARATLPRRAVIDTSKGFASRYIETSGGVTHSHGPEGAHSHAGIAYTTWLDLDQAAQQGAEIMRAIADRRPALKEAVKERFVALRTALEALDTRLKTLGTNAPALLASHPVYQYMARRYDLDIDALDWEPGAMPTDAQWKELEARLARRPAKILLWEAEPPAEAVTRLEALGVKSVVFDPCAGTPASGDFLDVMDANIARLEAAVRGG